jgi:hypothetical protein
MAAIGVRLGMAPEIALQTINLLMRTPRATSR